MSFTRISNAEINSRGATTLPNQPQISAAALKEEFDAPAKQVVAPKVNNLMDELEASTSAGNLGAIAPAGRTGTTTQGVINSVSSDLAVVEAQAHTHPNKAVIDKFADDGTGLTYDGDPVGAVTSVNGQIGAVSLTASDVGALPANTPIPTNTSDLTNDSDFVADASYVHTDNNYDATAKGIVDGATAAIAAKSTVSWNQIDTTGTKIAEITIDGVKTDVKATGGGSADAYKTITSGGQSFVASGADTFKINAGSNVTITPLTGEKGIQINAAGGGQSTGDMLMSDYDPNGTVKSSTNGITGYVASEIAKIDVDDLHDTSIASLADQDTLVYNGTSGTWGNEPLADVALTGAYSSLTGQPTIPDGLADLTDDVAISSPSSGQILQHNGTKWANANMPSIPDGLADLTDDVNISSPSNDQVLKYDSSSSKWVNGAAPASGHNMLDNSTIISGIKGAITEGATNDDVVSGYGVGIWSNTDTITLLTTVAQGDDTVGTWEDDATWESGSRAYWLKHTALHGILSDDDVEISLVFDVADGEAISCLAYRIDDAITSSLGGIAIKFNAPVQNASGATVGVVLKRNRTNTETVPRTS